MLCINVFYQLKYDETDFYSQFYNRLDDFYQEYDKISTLFF